MNVELRKRWTIGHLLFWGILVLFTGLTAWWIAYVPYNPVRLYQAIPADALWVSFHDSLGDRWESLVGNPLVRSSCLAQGMKAAEFDKFVADPRNKHWAQQLAGHQSVIAYVPRFGSPPEPALVFATWIGGASQRLRWNLLLSRGSDLKPIYRSDGAGMWVVDPPTNSSRARLSLALTEGVLLGCWSENPAGVRYLLDRIDREPGAGSPAIAGLMARVAKLWHEPAPDRGWVLPGSAPGDGLAPLMAFTFKINANGSITGMINTDTDAPKSASDSVARTNRMKELGSFLNGVPALALYLPWAAWQDSLIMVGMASNRVAAVGDTLGAMMQSPGGESRIGMFLLRDEYSARLSGPFRNALSSLVRGVKTPSLLIALEITNGVDSAQACVHAALDRINAQWGWGLIPHPVLAGAGTMIVIEETKSNLYSRFDQDERIACAALDHWLVLCSSAGVLRRLLEQDDRRTSGETIMAEWAVGEAGGWIDMVSAQKTFRDLIGLISIAALVSGGEGTDGVRHGLTQARSVLRAVQGLKSVAFQVEPDPARGGTRIPFRIEALAPAPDRK